MIQKLNNRKPQPTIGVSSNTGDKTMPTNTANRAKLPVLIAAWVLVAIIALIGSGLAGNAHAQAETRRNTVPDSGQQRAGTARHHLASPRPRHPPTTGSAGPTFQHGIPLLQRSPNEAERGNVYPDVSENTLTLNEPDAGRQTTRSKSEPVTTMRTARYTERSGPWTDTATFQVMEEPEDTPTPQPTATPTPEPTQEPTPGPTLPAAPTGLTTSQVSP